MQHTQRFLSGDGHVLLEEPTLAYGLMSGYERGPTALGLPAGTQVRVELLDEGGRLLDWRTYVVPVTSREVTQCLLTDERANPVAAMTGAGAQDARVDREADVLGRQGGEQLLRHDPETR